MLLYEYVDRRGRGVISEWWCGLQKSQQAKVDERFDRLASALGEEVPQLVEGPIRGWKHLYKIKIRGNIQIRIFLCKGPVEMIQEMTLLATAVEKDRKLVPPTVREEADKRRLEIAKDPQGRRQQYEL